MRAGGLDFHRDTIALSVGLIAAVMNKALRPARYGDQEHIWEFVIRSPCPLPDIAKRTLSMGNVNFTSERHAKYFGSPFVGDDNPTILVVLFGLVSTEL